MNENKKVLVIFSLLLMLVITLGCSSVQFQKAKSHGQKPWGKCQIINSSISLDKSFDLYQLKDAKRASIETKTWVEGHLSFMGHKWALSVRSEQYKDSTSKVCSFRTELRKDGIKSVSSYSELIDCKDGMNIVPLIKLGVKVPQGKWEILEVRCWEHASL